MIAIGFLPENVAEWFETYSLMGAGIATQQTVEPADAIPLDPLPGLGIVAAYAATALALALWAIRRATPDAIAASRLVGYVRR